jgi:hypothetical protein
MQTSHVGYLCGVQGNRLYFQTVEWNCAYAVRFQVLTVAGIKVSAFWGIVQCSVVELSDRPDDGDSTHL